MRKKARCLLLMTVMVAAPLSALFAVGWYWLNQERALEDEIAQRTDRLRAYQRILNTLPMLRAELEEVNANEELKSLYFDAATPALAGAMLQRFVKDLVGGAGGHLTSSQVLPASPADNLPKVRLRAQFQGSVATLLDVLLGVEQARPLVFIEQLSIRSMARGQRGALVRQRGQGASQTPKEDILTVRIDVFGYTPRDST